MSDDDLEYYAQRVDQELDQAQRATCPEAVHAHYVLANHYLDRIHGSGQAPPTSH